MFVPLTSDDRNNVAIALTTFADLGDVLMAEFRSTAPPEGSRVLVWSDDGLAGDQVAPTFTAINGAILSGADHLRSLNHLARVATTASVTVARGAVEAYAHAAYLATAQSATEIADRHLSALHKEYEFLITHSAPLINLDGAVLDVAEEQSKVDADRQRIGLGKAVPAGMTKKVKDLLNRATAGTSGAHVYSGLSSVAHAQLTGVGAFVSANETEVTGLAFDHETFVNLVFMVSAAADQALNDVTGLFGNQAAHRLLLDQAHRIVAGARTALVTPEA